MKRMLRSICLLLCVLTFTSLFSGCYDQKGIDELAYPLAMGLDVGNAGKLRLSLQIATPLKSSGGDSKGGEQESSSVIAIDCSSIYTGLNNLNNVVSKEINISHTKVLVISSELAKIGVHKYLNSIMRGRQFRPDAFIVISQGPAYKYLENVKPILENNTSKYFELMLGNNINSTFPNGKMNIFFNSLESDSKQAVAILTDIGKYDSADELNDVAVTKTDISESDLKADARDLATAAQKHNVTMGMAVFKEDRMISTCNGEETICYQMITGNFNKTFWIIPDPKNNDESIVIHMHQSKKPEIKIDSNDTNYKIHLLLDIEFDLSSIGEASDYEQKPEIVEEALKNDLENKIEAFLKRTTEEFESDICGFGKYVRSKAATWDEWKKLKWDEKYKDVEFDVNVKTVIKRTGLILNAVNQS